MSLGNAQILQLLAANVKTLACVVPVEEFGSQYGVQILRSEERGVGKECL